MTTLSKALSTHSLRIRLLGFLLVAIVVTAGVQGAIAYRSARTDADDIFDYHMQQTAMALRNGMPVSRQGSIDPLPDDVPDTQYVVQVWTEEGVQVFRSAITQLPPRAVLGFSEVPANGTVYRVFSMQSRTQVIQVAQDMAVRAEMARTLALRTIAPIAVMAPLLMLLVWWVVKSSMAPVARVGRQLAQRQADELSEVNADGLPDEIQPLVGELNLLLVRLRRAFDAQNRFVADAAHELRSPLAALKLQLQSLQRAPDLATRELAVSRLTAGIDRSTRLVEQLLLLARQQASAASGRKPGPVVLAELVRQEIVDAAASAQARRIDLGLGEADDRAIPAHPDAVRILVRNLLDNAIKYSPVGGKVDVAIRREQDRLLLTVDDDGPGIPVDERERVLDRFYRVAGTETSGSGLGMAIVKAIAELHAAPLTLSASPMLGGLRVEIAFPLAAEP